MKVGLIVNPIAGIGGKVGLRGSDGPEILARARALGARAESNVKTLVALRALAENATQVQIYTCPGAMGEEVCLKAGFKPVFIYQTPAHKTATGDTTSADTVAAARSMCEAGVELLLFAGGDGTARNIMDAVGEKVLVLGIPAGCKIHSGVYALNPRDAGALAAKVVNGSITMSKAAEVMDIDEDLFRQNIVQARLYGYLCIPDDALLMQCSKSAGSSGETEEVAAVAEYVAEQMEPEVLYIVGTGSTTAAVMQELGLPFTLLGVDLVYNKQVLARDCTEQQILAALTKYPQAKIIATVIGGQGYVFGRGNQQISAAVLKRVGRDNVLILAAKSKIFSLPNRRLYVDTGDPLVNKMFTGYARVIVGYKYEMVLPIGQ